MGLNLILLDMRNKIKYDTHDYKQQQQQTEKSIIGEGTDINPLEIDFKT
jgi:hypothetical protein